MASSTPAAAVFSRSLLPVAALVAMAGCTSVRLTEESLDGAPWQVTEINGRTVPATHLYRMEFEDGQVAGRFGCNQFRGSYRLERDRLTTGGISSTRIGCPEPSATHEAQASLILGQPMRIDSESAGRLTLSNEAGSIGLQR